jgi:16S rRNA (guanine(1405)-N(7))-methyltransferase
MNDRYVESIISNVRSSPKYRSICPSTIRRIAAEEWAKHGALKRAIKATKSRLHQIHGAYESHVDYDRAYRSLEAAYATQAGGAIQQVCRRLLSLHASTRERLPVLDRFYDEIFAYTSRPHSLLDLACGLTPLSLPWMGLDEGTAYDAYDIDADRIAFLDRYLSLAGMKARAHLQDIICDPPAERAEVALLLKSSTCLERQKKESTLTLLDALDVSYVVVTFPTKSLGRREKGMVQHYERTFQTMLSSRSWPVTRLDFASELVFIVNKE